MSEEIRTEEETHPDSREISGTLPPLWGRFPFYRKKTATEGAVSLHIPPRTQKISPRVKKTAGEV